MTVIRSLLRRRLDAGFDALLVGRKPLLASAFLVALNSRPLAALAAARALARIGRERDGLPPGLTRALRSVALNRIPRDEREISREIERRRQFARVDETPVRPFEVGLPTTVAGASRLLSLPLASARLLMRLVRELNPATAIELGTGLGVSASYQAAALDLNGSGRLYTVDGSPEFSRIAAREAAALGLSRVEFE